MKTSTLIYLGSTLLFLSTFTSCNQPVERLNDATDEILDEPQASREESVKYLAEMEQYKKENMAALQQNTVRIGELRKEADDGRNWHRWKTLETLTRLERQNNDLRMRIIDFTGDGMQSWRSFKAEFTSDMKTVSNSLNMLSNNIKD